MFTGATSSDMAPAQWNFLAHGWPPSNSWTRTTVREAILPTGISSPIFRPKLQESWAKRPGRKRALYRHCHGLNKKDRTRGEAKGARHDNPGISDSGVWK